MFVLDSLGMLSTEKEIQDALDDKQVRDMTKSQLVKGAFRMLTLKLGQANVPLLVTNHTYDVIGAYVPTKEMGGGSGLKYAASTIIYLSKKKEKDGTEVVGNIIKANELCHGKKSNIKHNGDSIFSGIEELYSVVRYHSLIVEKNTLPKELKIIATLENDTDVIMAIEHENKPIYGVQFHPESIDTEYGMRLIQNFISI